MANAFGVLAIVGVGITIFRYDSLRIMFSEIDADPNFSEVQKIAAKAMAVSKVQLQEFDRFLSADPVAVYQEGVEKFDGQAETLQYLIDTYNLNDLPPPQGTNDSDGDGRADGQGGSGGGGGDGGGAPKPPKKPNREDDQGSPLVFDLDGDGVELYAVGDYGSYFDLRGNGNAVLTGWVEPDDGLLALDVNGDGVINDITELFGSIDTDGFTQLQVLDSNGDGVIDSNDAAFADLLLWTDVNSDGISQADELHIDKAVNDNCLYKAVEHLQLRLVA